MKHTINCRFPNRMTARGVRGRSVILFLFIPTVVLLASCQQPIGQEQYSPVAYGTVLLDGEIISGTGNFTITHSEAGHYDIAVAGHTFTNDNTVVEATLYAAGAEEVISWARSFDVLTIYIRSASTGTFVDRGFSFTIWEGHGE
ncbi:MAG: hypothetical protein JXD23_02255 [Spirochaetales bacterium]|nr:hypothetical protein [Spirochaetales bacterium]